MTQTIRTEKLVSTIPGLLMLPVLLLAAAAFGRFGIAALQGGTPLSGILFMLAAFISIFCLGGLFVVNVFPNDDAHTRFGRSMGGPMEAVGLSSPQLEHLDVLAIRFQTI